MQTYRNNQAKHQVGHTATLPAEAKYCIPADLKKQKEESEALCQDLGTNGKGKGGAKKVKMIPRPKGTLGTHWSIQIEMGLEGPGKKKYGRYKAIQVSIPPRGEL